MFGRGRSGPGVPEPSEHALRVSASPALLSGACPALGCRVRQDECYFTSLFPRSTGLKLLVTERFHARLCL